MSEQKRIPEYSHTDIEKKWQSVWEKNNLYTVEDTVVGKENFYTLVEFAYPSGNLHVGHWYAFSVPDMFARYKRMRGYNVLYPMGFDAFGLPAENAAIKNKLDPKTWTHENMNYMRGQLRSMGTMFDWSREVVTCDPDYYRWTQWMFTKFLEKDLVYRATTQVNWCPKDQTVLANEQVIDGVCDRCGSEVIQKNQDQWMFRITKYADRLTDDLEGLDWPEHIKEAQRNWIGRSEGAQIGFKIQDSGDKKEIGKIEVFTTRPDTLFGVTYVVLAPEHPFIEDLMKQIQNKDAVEKYILATQKKSDLDRQQSKDKTGVQFEGIEAINPVNGEVIPVWVADYVLAGYGTGAVMAVPAHDERDFTFATKYNLPIKEVIIPVCVDTMYPPNGLSAYTGEGKLVHSGEYTGKQSEESGKAITEKAGGRMVKTYRIRDWGISRQRYWGVPIPIVYDPSGKAHAVPEKNLPWLLPTDVDHTPDGTAPLARSKELQKRVEDIFGKGWKPEVETMDTFVDSSWYFYRYLDPKNSTHFSSDEARKAWMPISMYFGGAEHTTMHLLYSRLWTKALHDLGFVAESEAYTSRRNRGLILGPDGNKMSKSKGNVIDPDEVVRRLGADTVRMYLAFMGPYADGGNYPWDQNGVVGVRRFLERVWKLSAKVSTETKENLPIKKALHRTIKKVTDDMEQYKFNTCISQLMIFLNVCEKELSIPQNHFETFLQLLAPFAPHISEELWMSFGYEKSIHLSLWPTYDPALLVDDEITIAVQINGKLRATIVVSKNARQEELESMAQNQPDIQKWLENKPIKKLIVIAGKVVNIVV